MLCSFFMLAARTTLARRKFNYIIPSQICQAKCEKKCTNPHPEICAICMLTFKCGDAIMYLQGKEREVHKMALDKAIMNGKEHRKMYKGAKAIDKTCRNHGSCEWCAENRQYKNLKKLQKTLDMMKDF